MKNIRFFFLSENFHFLVVKFSVYLNRHVFVMHSKGQRTVLPWIPVPTCNGERQQEQESSAKRLRETLTFERYPGVVWVNKFYSLKCPLNRWAATSEICIRAVWSESLLGAVWPAKDANFLHSDKEDFRLRWEHVNFLVFLYSNVSDLPRN